MRDGWVADFDALAPTYDQRTAQDDWRLNDRAAEMLAPLGLAPARILDLGAGTGQTAEALLRLFPDAEVTLVDPAPGMLRAARAKLPGATFVEEDAAAFLAASAGRWDLVSAIGCLELVPDLFEVLRLAAARLAPGGHLVASHEPLLGTGVQARPVSILDRGRAVSRHAVEEVERRAASYGLRRVASRVETAFQRGDGDGAAVYELVVWSAGGV
ncbi:class I SAM-dependent methyltransferase [Nocardioides eburneiflavus]|uniref:Class I SAM-dependent methyltransferase n=1 Tax=Nocardioides eburneiflavus TaxID=2518372 RepID=A0A4Z1CIN0_9ACTN|nr:class I SAM-dependent methyltransferase [Nocardioides eburneiflavus]TGN65907.1 class I SAM-dependent methyltransferase [Nocardioides eburneiflavus]